MMDDRKISEMRNLGPATEQTLNAAGIQTAEQVQQLGVEATYQRMIEVQIAQGKKLVVHPAYLYAIYGALEDCDWREVPAAKKREFKVICDRLRKQYHQ